MEQELEREIDLVPKSRDVTLLSFETDGGYKSFLIWGYFEESDWEKMNEFLIDVSVRMEKAFKEPIKKLNNQLKNK